MKKIIHKLKFVAVALLAFSASSCDAILDDEVTDFGDTPVLVQFVEPAITANFIQTPANEVYTYQIPVMLIGGRNQPLNKPVDVTVAVDPSSTAVEGVEFNLITQTVTIPAGEMMANVEIEVLSENLDPFDAKILVLEITSSDLTISESTSTAVVLQGACELNLAGFLGTYDALEDGAFEYKVEITEGPQPNTLLLTNLYDTAGETIIKLSEDPTAPSVTYLSKELGAALMMHPTYGAVWATMVSPGAATYGSCDNSLKLVFKRCVGAGCFAGTINVVLTKQEGATPM